MFTDISTSKQASTPYSVYFSLYLTAAEMHNCARAEPVKRTAGICANPKTQTNMAPYTKGLGVGRLFFFSFVIYPSFEICGWITMTCWNEYSLLLSVNTAL